MTQVIRKNKTQSELLEGVKEYGKLREKLEKQGVFDRAYGYYGVVALVSYSGFFICMYLLFIEKSILQLLLTGFVFAFFSVQVAGLLHDAGHRAIFKSPLMNDIFGYICGAVVGMGYGGWRIKHDMHHSHPNQEDEDPDLELPLLSFTKERLKKKKGFAHLIRRYQAYLYYPMGSMVGFSVRVESVKYLIRNFEYKKLWEFALLGTGVLLWFGLPFVLFPLTKAILLFLVVNFSIGFYLLNVFAPNHKGMPQFGKHVKISFIDQQIMTSRNIYGHWLTDYIYMGLNYQIEHHLFPNTPRNKLQLITPYVAAICKKRKLEFTRTSILQSNKLILAELNEVALAS